MKYLLSLLIVLFIFTACETTNEPIIELQEINIEFTRDIITLKENGFIMHINSNISIDSIYMSGQNASFTFEFGHYLLPVDNLNFKLHILYIDGRFTDHSFKFKY